MKMKVLLINPPYINFEGMKESGGHMAPFNLAYLAGYLRREVDCEIKILDTEALGLNYQEIEKFLEQEKPDIAGFTCLSPTVNHVFKICEIIKTKLKTNCITVLGGIHPTILPTETMGNPHVDFAVIGEGEITFSELVKFIKEKRDDFEKINGLCYKKDGKILNSSPREFIPDLDSIPFPARDLLDLKLYYSAPTKKLTSDDSTSILTSRGCAFDCIHCVSKSIWHRKIRYRSAENVVAEIEECINKFNIKEFSILDDNFTLNKERAIKICQQIIDKKLPIAWICFSRSDTINEELLSSMEKAGCKKISLGLESGSQKVLDLMRKQNTVESAKKAVNLIQKYHIKVHASFMFGNIGETTETIKETIKLAKNLSLDNATFFITCPVPGSDLYYYAKQNGFIKDNTPWEAFAPLTNVAPIVVQNNLNQEELIYWQKRAFKKFYLRPKYILYKIKQLNSIDAFKTLMEGFRVFYRIIFKKNKK